MQTLSLGFFCFWMVFDFKEVLDTFQLVTFEDQLDQLKPLKPIKQLHTGFKYFLWRHFTVQLMWLDATRNWFVVPGACTICRIVQCWMVNLVILLNILFTYTIN